MFSLLLYYIQDLQNVRNLSLPSEYPLPLGSLLFSHNALVAYYTRPAHFYTAPSFLSFFVPLILLSPLDQKEKSRDKKKRGEGGNRKEDVQRISQYYIDICMQKSSYFMFSIKCIFACSLIFILFFFLIFIQFRKKFTE